jgi:alpha-D-ribose 1-methylphosphonate 5-triphosphate synthase subunit PhnG
MKKHDGERRAWMGLLSRARFFDLRRLASALDPLPPSEDLRAPEIGLIMVRGRISGNGAPFNLGEMTVTRCSVRVSGVLGHSLVPGRNLEHARLAALLDGLLQTDWHDRITASVLTALSALEAEASARHAAETKETRVDFFTLVRGESE